MVAIVTGNGLGLQSSSALGLGSRGQLGQAGLGKSSEQAYINAATGNLILRGRDQLLIGQGVNGELYRAYNSQAQLAGEHWRPGTSKTVNGLSGALGAVGSTVVRTDWDGSAITYTWDAARGKYVADSGAGARDTLAWEAGSQQWVWTQGSSGLSERYAAGQGGRLIALVDRDGNTVQYLYNAAGLLSEVRTASGEVTCLDYVGTQLSQLRTVGQGGGATATTVRYGYDGLGRLSTIVVDLSPEDNSIADGQVYTTTYGYEGGSHRIASISESDGTRVAFTYQQIGGEYRVASLTQTSETGEVRVTTLEYDLANRRTTITDPLGQATVLSYDAQGRLLQSTTPAVNGVAQTQRFSYDGNGQVASVEDALGRVTRYGYDDAGNLIRQEDALGNVLVRTYGADNELLSETLSGPNTTPATTRYVYDGERHLRFVVSAEGRVSEYCYNAAGQVVATLAYTTGRYPVGSTADEAALAAWAGSRQGEVTRTETSYDFRGNVASVTSYGTVRADGSGVLDDQASQTRYVYDPTGRLVQRYVGAIGQQQVEQYSYDGLGRMLSVTALDGRTTLYQYDDARQQTIVTFASGLVRTSTYNLAGELVAVAESQAGRVLSQVSYQYDRNGRLRLSEDAAGARTYYLYDEAGRQVAMIDASGALTEYSYDGNNQVTRTLQYAQLVSAAKLATLTDAQGRIIEGATLASVRPVHSLIDRMGWRLYDEGGRLVRTVNAAGNVVDYRYDAASRLTMTIAYESVINLTRFSADPSWENSNVASNSSGNVYKRYIHDEDGLLVATLEQSGVGYRSYSMVEYQYDAAGRKVGSIGYATRVADTPLALTGTVAQLRPMISAGNDIHQYFVYDRRGLLMSEVDGEGYVTRYRYDSQGNVTQRIRGEKVAAASLNTPTQVSGSVRARGVAGSDGVWPQLEVWVDGVKVSTLTLNCTDTTYTFTAMVAPGAAHQVSLVYANTGQGREAWIGEASLAGVAFDASGAVLWDAGGAGAAQGVIGLQTAGEQHLVQAGALRWGVDVVQVLAHLATLPGALERTEYAYDLMGRVMWQVQYASEGAMTTQYIYDGEGRLVGEQRGNRASALRYDVQGRLIGQLGGEGSAALVALGANPSQAQIEAVWAQWGVCYDYDAAGQRTAMTDALGRTTHYYYDVTGRMTHTVNALGEVVAYQYNTFGEVSQTITYATRLSSLILGGLRGGALNEDLAETFRQLDSAQASKVMLNHNVLGLVSQRIDALGYYSEFVYNQFGQVVETTRWATAGRINENKIVTYQNYMHSGQLYSQRVFAREVDGVWRSREFYNVFYDAFGRPLTVTENGVSHVNYYDRTGNIVTISNENAYAMPGMMSYDAFGNVLTQKDFTGNTTRYSYTAFNREIRMTTAEGVQTLTRYNEHGQVVEVVDGHGNVTTYEYDHDGRLIRSTNPSGTVSTAYDQAGQVIETVDARGTRIKYSYDAAGRTLSRVVDPDGLALTQRYEYDAKGQVIRSIDAQGTVTTTEYDLKGQAVKVVTDAGTDRLNLTTTFLYDGLGQVLRVTEGAGTAAARVTAYAYDKSGHRISMTVDPDGLALTTRYSYDEKGNVVASTDANGEVARYVYDKRNRLSYSIVPGGIVTYHRYDLDDRLLETIRYSGVINASGWGTQVTAADVQGRLQASATYDRRIRYVYDGDGRLRYTIGALNQVTENVYDAAGNIVRSVAYATAIASTTAMTVAAVRAALTAQGSSAHANDRASQTVYDAANRPQFQVNADGYVTGYRHDANGNVLERIAYTTRYTDTITASALQSWANTQGSTARIVDTWVYDSANRPAWHVDAGGILTEQRYDAAGRVVAQLIYIDTGAPRTDTASQLQNWAATRQSRAAITRWYYDAAGRQVYTQDAEGYVSERQYDANGQVTCTVRYEARFPTITASDTVATIATRLAGQSGAASTLRYDAAGRTLEQADALGGVTRFEYDGLGQVTAMHVAWGTALQVTTQRRYDALGQLVGETRAAGTPLAATMRFAYNAFGQQVSVTDPRGVELAESDSAWALAQRKALGYVNETGTPWYAADLSATQKAQLLARYTSTVAYDANGNRVRTADALGNAVDYVYDAFGNAMQVTDARGNVGYFYYDALGRVTAQVDPAGYLTCTEYDAQGNPVTVTRYMGKVSGTVNATTPPATPTGAAAVTRMSYDLLGRLTQATDAEGGIETYGYDAYGNRISYTNKLGGTTQFTYDKLGRVLSEQLPAQVRATNGSPITLVNRYSYDARGNRISSVEAEGTTEQRATTYTYDALDRQTASSTETMISQELVWSEVAMNLAEVVSASTQSTYDARGNLIERVDANGVRTRYYYDAGDRLIAQVSARGALTLHGYDQAGNRITTRAYDTVVTAITGGPVPAVPAGGYRETQYIYDANNRLIESRVPNVITASKNPVTGNFDIVIGDVVQTWEYDADGRVTRYVDGNSGVTRSYYDVLGQKTLEIDAEGYAITWQRDAEGNVVREVRIGLLVSATELAAADAAGRWPQVSEYGRPGMDRVTEYAYDLMGRRISESRQDVEYGSVDAQGKLTYQYGNATTGYAYDAAGNLLRRTDANGNVYRWEYDLVGRNTAVVLPSMVDYTGHSVNARTEYRYNGLNQVTQEIRKGISAGEDQVDTYVYGAGGLLLSKTNALGYTTYFDYDVAGNMIEMWYATSTSDYLYNKMNQIIINYDVEGNEVRRIGFQYKDLYSGPEQLLERRVQYNLYGEVTGRGTGNEGWQEYAEYDSAGRAVKSNAEGGVTHAYLYDKNGNATMRMESQATDLRPLALEQIMELQDVFTTFTVYDKRNQATEVIQPTMQTTGERLKVNSGWGTTTAGSNKIEVLLGSVTPTAPGVPQLGIEDGVMKVTPSASSLAKVTFNGWPEDAIRPGASFFFNAVVPDLSSIFGAYDLKLTSNGYTGYASGNPGVVGIEIKDALFDPDLYMQYPRELEYSVSVSLVVVQKSTGKEFNVGQFGQSGRFGFSANRWTQFKLSYIPPSGAFSIKVPSELDGKLQLPSDGFRSDINPQIYVRQLGSTGAYQMLSIDRSGSPATADISGLANGAYEVLYIAERNGNQPEDVALMRREQYHMTIGPEQNISRANESYSVGSAYMTNAAGSFVMLGDQVHLIDLRTRQGLTPGGAFIEYRRKGSQDAWQSTSYLGNVPPMATWGSHIWNTAGLSGDYEVAVRLVGGNGVMDTLIGDVSIGTNPRINLDYVPQPGSLRFSSLPSAADCMSLVIKRANGTVAATMSAQDIVNCGLEWAIPSALQAELVAGTANWTFEATFTDYGVVPTATYTVTRTMTVNASGNTSGDLNFAAAGGLSSLTFDPKQSASNAIKLYYRLKGSQEVDFKSITLLKDKDGIYRWDAIGLQQGNDYEYYYDVYATQQDVADGNAITRVTGYFTPTAATSQTGWVLWQHENISASSVLIQRKQTYNAFGEIVSEIDGRGNVTELTYNALGLLAYKSNRGVQITLANGFQQETDISTHYIYDRVGSLVGYKDANGNLTTQAWNYGSATPLVAKEWHADGGVKAYGHDVFGNQRVMVDELGRQTDYSYDAGNRLVRIDRPVMTNGQRNWDTYEYDELDRRIAHSNTLGRETTDYDIEGNVSRYVSMAGRETTWASYWVPAGSGGYWQKVMTDANGRTSVDEVDAHGRLLKHKDLGNHWYTYQYNHAGLLVQNGTTSYEYYNNGLLKYLRSSEQGTVGYYEYDRNGNRTFEGFTGMNGQWAFQQSVATYDSLNRLVKITDPRYAIDYEYDAVGNRIHMRSEYNDALGGDKQVQDYWYQYDSLNRFVVTMGQLKDGNRGSSATDTNAYVWMGETGGDGVQIAYDMASQRKQAVYASDGHKEDYYYDAQGYLTDTTIDNVLRARRVNDLAGRVTDYIEYDAAGQQFGNLTRTWDADSLLMREHNNMNSTGTTTYRLADGTVDYTETYGDTTTQKLLYSYDWYDAARQTEIKVQASNSSVKNWAPGFSKYEYDSQGRIKIAYDVAGNRGFSYQTDGEGRILQRDELIGGKVDATTGKVSGASNNRFHSYYLFDDRQVGNIGNDGIDRIDYARELAQHQVEAGAKNDERHKRFTPVAGADFDSNYRPINSLYPSAAPGSYLVRAGDTLQSIALALWGDSAMWYVLADANGLTAQDVLTPNTSLTVPNKVTNLHNNAGTFKPYDAGAAMGNTNPTVPDAPPPPQQKKGCGKFVQVIAVVVAVVVTYFTYGATKELIPAAWGAFASGAAAGATAGAAGSVASQGVLMAGGEQSGFNWKGLAVATAGGAITGGITQGVGQGQWAANNPVLAAAGTAAINSVVTQGVAMAVGLQGSFDWKSVGISAVSAGIGNKLGASLDKKGWHPAAVDFTQGMAVGTISAAMRGNLSSEVMFQVGLDAMSATIGGSISRQLESQKQLSRTAEAAQAQMVVTNQKLQEQLTAETMGLAEMRFAADSAVRMDSYNHIALEAANARFDAALDAQFDSKMREYEARQHAEVERALLQKAALRSTANGVATGGSSSFSNIMGVLQFEPSPWSRPVSERLNDELMASMRNPYSGLSKTSPPATPKVRDKVVSYLRELAGDDRAARVGVGVVDGYLGLPEMLGQAGEAMWELSKFSTKVRAGEYVIQHGLGDTALNVWSGGMNAGQSAFMETYLDQTGEVNGKMLFALGTGVLAEVRLASWLGASSAGPGRMLYSELRIGENVEYQLASSTFAGTPFAAASNSASPVVRFGNNVEFFAVVPNSVVNVWHATTNPRAARGVFDGIDPKFLNPNSRFGAAFYVAERPGTTLAELVHHGATPTTGIRFTVDRGAMNVLDLTDPEASSLI